MTPKVIFKFDKEKDLWNNWHRCNRDNKWGVSAVSLEIKNACEGKSFEESKKELAKILSPIHNSYIIELDVKSVEEAWMKIEEEFFRRMDKIMKHEYTKNINAYLTTAKGCPYDEDEPSFMFSLRSSLPDKLMISGHEIMHLYFHKFYWDKIEKRIGKEKTDDLKEALTVLLNIEFKDLWFSEDKGYEPHKELREFIVKSWGEEKDFDKLIKKCIKWFKENEIKYLETKK
jgi:hypothetical protein